MRAIGSDTLPMRRALVLVLVLVAMRWQGQVVPADADPHAPPDAPPDALVVPVFRNPVNLPDDSSRSPRCRSSARHVPGARHELQRLPRPHAAAAPLLARALRHRDGDVPDRSRRSRRASRRSTMIDCMRSMPGMPQSDFQTKKLGIYATGDAPAVVRVRVLDGVRRRAAGTKLAGARQATAGMPQGRRRRPLTQAQFDIVAEWFVARPAAARADAAARSAAAARASPASRPTSATHVTAMATHGLARASTRPTMMAMYGCGAATDPKLCLGDVPLGADQPYGAGWDLPGRGKLRVLTDVTYAVVVLDAQLARRPVRRARRPNVPGSYVIDLQRDAR